MHRRSELNFIFRLCCDMVSLGLWLAVFLGNGTINWIYTVTLFNYFMYIITDFYGIINWTRMKISQNKTKDGINEEIWLALKDLD